MVDSIQSSNPSLIKLPQGVKNRKDDKKDASEASASTDPNFIQVVDTLNKSTVLPVEGAQNALDPNGKPKMVSPQSGSVAQGISQEKFANLKNINQNAQSVKDLQKQVSEIVGQGMPGATQAVALDGLRQDLGQGLQASQALKGRGEQQIPKELQNLSPVGVNSELLRLAKNDINADPRFKPASLEGAKTPAALSQVRPELSQVSANSGEVPAHFLVGSQNIPLVESPILASQATQDWKATGTLDSVSDNGISAVPSRPVWSGQEYWQIRQGLQDPSLNQNPSGARLQGIALPMSAQGMRQEGGPQGQRLSASPLDSRNAKASRLGEDAEEIGFSGVRGKSSRSFPFVERDLQVQPGTAPHSSELSTFLANRPATVMPKLEVAGHVVKGAMALDRLSSQSLVGMSDGIRNMAMVGGGTLTLHLKPDNLGQLQIQVHTRGNRVGLRIEATSEEAKRILEDSLIYLHEKLASEKLSLAKVDFSVHSDSLGNKNDSLMSSQDYQNSRHAFDFDRGFNQQAYSENRRSGWDSREQGLVGERGTRPGIASVNKASPHVSNVPESGLINVLA